MSAPTVLRAHDIGRRYARGGSSGTGRASPAHQADGQRQQCNREAHDSPTRHASSADGLHTRAVRAQAALGSSEGGACSQGRGVAKRLAQVAGDLGLGAEVQLLKLLGAQGHHGRERRAVAFGVVAARTAADAVFILLVRALMVV